MAGPVIRLGDKASHGGSALEASAMTDSGGIGIARVGDKTSCGAVLIASQQATTDQV